MQSRSIDKGGSPIQIIRNKELRDHGLFPWRGITKSHKYKRSGNNPHQPLEGDKRIPDDPNHQEQHQGIPKLDLLPGFSFMGSNNLLAPACRDGPDYRVIIIIRIGIDEDILELFLWEEFCHCLRKHGLSSPGASDHHHVPPLYCSLFDDLNRVFLADDLVNQLGRHFHL